MKKFNKIKILNLIIAIAFVVAMGYKFYLSDKSATAGRELNSYENEIASLEQENNYLLNRYLSLTSLSNVKPLAEANGYVDAALDYYVTPPLAAR